MNVSLPEELRRFVDERVDDGGYGSTSEFIRALIRRERDRQELRALLVEGASSPVAGPADDAYFATLRSRVETAD